MLPELWYQAADAWNPSGGRVKVWQILFIIFGLPMALLIFFSLDRSGRPDDRQETEAWTRQGRSSSSRVPSPPGTESPVKVMKTQNPAMKRAGVEFKYLLGGTIPFRNADTKARKGR